MKNRKIVLSFIAIVATVAIVFSACRKINEATELGGGLIPPVDNINTFDTTLTVFAYNDTFGLANDSQYLAKTDEFFLGRINTDLFFGKTDARLFLELKPPFFKFTFLDKPDSLSIDSVVLILDYVETYGDTTVPQTVNVFEIDQNSNFRSDTAYLIRKNEIINGRLLGSRTFLPSVLNDSVKAFQDTTANQLRIKLHNSFGAELLSYDSSGNNPYGGDSLFRKKFKGFALETLIGTGNAVMGFDLTGANTKLAIYYKNDNRVIPTVPKLEDAVAYFIFTGNCAAANYVKRDYSSTPLLASLINNAATPDPVIYIQGSPGTFANLKIPALATLSNRVIHRAELIVEQLYDRSDSTFRPPDYLYLDAFDPTIPTSYQFRTIPYDVNFTSSGALNLGAFGSVPVRTIDPFGNSTRTWKFNISRYVQHVLTKTQTLYDLRLSAPYALIEKFGIPPGQDISTGVVVNPAIVKGRVRLSGNTDPLDPNPRRIRLRLIYSKL